MLYGYNATIRSNGTVVFSPAKPLTAYSLRPKPSLASIPEFKEVMESEDHESTPLVEYAYGQLFLNPQMEGPAMTSHLSLGFLNVQRLTAAPRPKPATFVCPQLVLLVIVVVEWPETELDMFWVICQGKSLLCGTWQPKQFWIRTGRPIKGVTQLLKGFSSQRAASVEGLCWCVHSPSAKGIWHHIARQYRWKKVVPTLGTSAYILGTCGVEVLTAVLHRKANSNFTCGSQACQ